MSDPLDLIKGQFTELVTGMENVISTLEKKNQTLSKKSKDLNVKKQVLKLLISLASELN